MLKSYPIAEKGSFWLGLLGWLAVPVAGGLAGRILASASGKSVDVDGPGYPVTQVMIGHALGLGSALYMRGHVPPGWQSFMKWGAIGSGVCAALAPVHTAVLGSSGGLRGATENMSLGPAPASSSVAQSYRKLLNL